LDLNLPCGYSNQQEFCFNVNHTAVQSSLRGKSLLVFIKLSRMLSLCTKYKENLKKAEKKLKKSEKKLKIGPKAEKAEKLKKI
jgi:hypothetical protein